MGTSTPAVSLDDFLAHSPDMLFVTDPDAGLVRASDVLAQALGLAAGVSASLIDLAYASDRDALKAMWARLAGDRSVETEVECRLRVADGTLATFLCKARRSSQSGHVHGSLRRLDLDAIETGRATSLLKTITESLDIVAWTIDREGRFTQQMGRGLKSVGLKEGEWIGQNIFDVYASSPEALEPVHHALDGGYGHFPANTHGMFWENWFVPVLDMNGQVRGAACLALNVTESKRTEQELLARLDLIERQRQAIQEMSIPIIQVWDSVLTVPLVGMVDSVRASELMEKLLGEVVRTRARFAVLDLTGVEAMDTSTASHMLRLVTALRLLGAEGILTGIRPSIAHTMVGLGLDMGSVKTLANLRAGLRFCMDRLNDSAGPRAPRAS